jgi:hypothetical protein
VAAASLKDFTPSGVTDIFNVLFEEVDITNVGGLSKSILAAGDVLEVLLHLGGLRLHHNFFVSLKEDHRENRWCVKHNQVAKAKNKLRIVHGRTLSRTPLYFIFTIFQGTGLAAIVHPTVGCDHRHENN